MKITELKQRKQAAHKMTMVTCYDYWSANIIAQSPVDMILIGDSAAMVMHGHASTIPATVDLMVPHIQAVAKGANNKLLIGDMPFLSYRKSQQQTMEAVEKIMQAGAHAIKLEGDDTDRTIEHIVQSGVSVFGHIGLTPQSMHALGGFKVQGKDNAAALAIIDQAKRLEDKGCVAIVLECIPSPLAETITQQLTIPTIGIGAGPHVDGQVLVLQDLLGCEKRLSPKFVKQYLDGYQLIHDALSQYHEDVTAGHFPTAQHCYTP